MARHLSYSKAGEELSLSQPAVSRQIAALEKGLGLDLFSQRGRQVVLTDAGRSLYDYADRIMGLAQQAARAMSQYHDLERGEVRLGVSPVVGRYLLPPILKDFYTRFPNIGISLQFDSSAQLARRVETGELDVALAVGPLNTENIHLERYAQDDLVLVCPPMGAGCSLNELFDRYPFITGEKSSSTGQIIEHHLKDFAFKPRFFTEIADAEVIKRLVISDMGLAFLPLRGVAPELADGTLLQVSGEGTVITRWIYLITTKDQHYCPTLLAFMNFIRKHQ